MSIVSLINQHHDDLRGLVRSFCLSHGSRPSGHHKAEISPNSLIDSLHQALVDFLTSSYFIALFEVISDHSKTPL